jgi:type VI secretion system protein ImpL
MDFTAISLWWLQWSPLQKALGAASGFAVPLFVLWMILRWRKPAIVVVQCTTVGAPCGVCARIGAWCRSVLDAFDYLATRREWRYRQPWMLMLGERGAGKSSLSASVSQTLRHAPPKRAAELRAHGTDWVFFDAGVLIDADGSLSAAEAGSEEAVQWKKTLVKLDALRPERPLDGVVLCVSARTLREAKAAERQETAANVSRQLTQLQEALEFALPIYVVVTQCDNLPGFGAFWKCQSAARRGELFGYSATPQDQSAPPVDWANAAFDLIGHRLCNLQVEVAAHTRHVPEVDSFFLFPGHLMALRENTAQWLETVFRVTAWQTGHLFRGLYFTGAIDAQGMPAQGPRKDVAFVDALVSAKALAEPHLARPTRHGIWSRNRLIRAVQVGAVCGMATLCAALVFAGIRIPRQVDTLVAAIDMLEKATAVDARNAGCLGSERVYPLLEQVARIDIDTTYLAIPASWVDSRVTQRSASLIGATVIAGVLMPALACHLETRARKMTDSAQDIPPAGSDLATHETALRRRVAEALALEQNLARFNTLVWKADTLDEAELLDMLAALSTYAFGVDAPERILRKGNMLDDAVNRLSGKANPETPSSWQQVSLPINLRQRLARQIETEGKATREALSREVARGGELLAALRQGSESVLENTRRFAEWLAWTRGAWLSSNTGNDPCGTILQSLRKDVETLRTRYAYQNSLSQTLTRFDETRCRQPERQVILGMTLPPHGPVFAAGEAGDDLAPALQTEFAGLPQLVSLGYMRLTSPRKFTCVGNAARWRPAEIAEAAGYLRDYEAFAKAHELPANAEREHPLYDKLARAALERALDDAMQRAQQLPATTPYPRVGIEAASRADTELAHISNEMTQALPALQGVLQAYADYGFASGATVRQCVNDFAADQLGRVGALAAASRLYAPQPATGGELLFGTGNLPVVKDYLARQVARAQVLVGYASPFVSLMQAAPPVNTAQRDTAQTLAYWRNTADELNRYTQAKEPSGQVAALDSYFIRQLGGLSYANCDAVLQEYTPPEAGNDLFSERRGQLEQSVSLHCADTGQALAFETCLTWAKRFNRDLAGRYPFGEIAARDANPAAVRAFFIDYAAQRTAVREALAALPKRDWAGIHGFIARLDGAADFFGGNLLAGAQGEPFKLTVSFNAMPSAATGADQLLDWQLSAGASRAGFPNRATTLDWYVGQDMKLDLTWADRSDWLPQGDPRQAALQVNGRRASFTLNGPWALLRAMEAHRPQGLPERDPANPEQRLLEFDVPVAASPGDDGKAVLSSARLFISIGAQTTDPKTQAAVPLKWPAGFPHSAPTE